MALPLIVEAEELLSFFGNQRSSKPNSDRNALLIVALCSEQSYLSGHIPGAIHVSPRELVSGKPPAMGNLPEAEQLEALFSRLGLREDSQVLAYDDEGGGWAGRFIWTLDVIGHRTSSYLNGGIWAWRAAQGPLSTEVPKLVPTSVKVQLHSEAVANRDEILAHLEDPNYLIWDARSGDEYRGEKNTAQRNGHIPGAIHCEWTELMDRQADLRIRKDARDYLQARGFDDSKTIATHCHSHHRSGFTYLVGKSLGLNIKAYAGSWSEWGNDPDTPVER